MMPRSLPYVARRPRLGSKTFRGMNNSTPPHTSKFRYELRRRTKRTKRLGEHCAGKLNLVRVDSEGQVPEFLADAAKVRHNTWQQRILGTRIANSEEQQSHSAARRRLF